MKLFFPHDKFLQGKFPPTYPPLLNPPPLNLKFPRKRLYFSK